MKDTVLEIFQTVISVWHRSSLDIANEPLCCLALLSRCDSCTTYLYSSVCSDPVALWQEGGANNLHG